MKRFFSIAILAFLLFNNCGGHKPVTEPASSPATDETLERLQNKENNKQDGEKKTPAAQETSQEQPVNESAPTSQETTTMKPAVETVSTVKASGSENIPLILPEKKPEEKRTEPKPIVLKPIKVKPGTEKQSKEITDLITTGITGIFREFGYSGNIEVPENFKRRVAYYIRYFAYDKKGSGFFLRSMKRSKKYMPMVRKILNAKHLPLSLSYLPVVESGFRPNARSHAGAVGMWQFMKGTARMYGLKVTRNRDDRRNPVKATHAAAEYLNDLLAMFGAEDPFLGICAYNAGEGKILRSLRKISYKERSFWTLVRKNLLRNETDEYIPRLLAVVLISKNPGKYAAASRVISVEPNEVEDLQIISTFHTSRVDLMAVSSHEKESPEVIELEPSTKNQSTPKRKSGKPTLRKNKIKKSRFYKVKRGDTLYSIARNHQVSVKNVKAWNGLRSNRIRPGQKLKMFGSVTKISRKKASKISRKGYKLIYTVNYTDSLARIALFFRGISARNIMKWNRLKRTRIYPKQKLTLYLKQSPRKVITNVVKRGDTAGKNAKKY
ncbi:MAG: LysM peptidoglycan-binding domain-containing protein, partial [bacterium]|nr:LysM peptidoglycan-binding domain-containing protein [bacterium]